MKTLGIGSVMALAMAALACGKPAPDTSSTLTLTGAVDTQRQALDNASAVAISSDGRTFSAYLQRNGRFTLDLPVGHVYRIIIANSTMSGELRPIGHLVNETSKGTADVIAVKDGGSLNLGTLRPIGTSSNTLQPKCGACGGSGDSDKDDTDDKGGGDHDDGDDKDDKDGDYKCEQKDKDKDRVCESSSDVELEAENAPGDKCAKDDDDKDAPKPPKKSCSTKDDDKDGKDDDDDKTGGGGYGDDEKSGGGGYGGGDAKGGGDESCSACAPKPPTSCTCSKQCATGSSCVASKCTPDKPADPSSTPPK